MIRFVAGCIALLITIIALPAYAADVPAPALTLHFDDDAAALPDGVSRGEGVSGLAVQVDANHYLPVGEIAPYLQQPTGSLAMWIKPVGWHGGDKLNHYFLVAVSADDQRRLFVQQASGPDALLGAYAQSRPDAGQVWIKDGGSWRDGLWRLMVITWDHDQLSVYMDGGNRSATNDGVPQWWAGPLERVWLGRHIHGEAGGATMIDQVRVYNAALRPDQIQALYERDVAQSPLLAERDTPWRAMDNNIADSAHRVTVIGSSKTRDRALQAEQAIDDDVQTAWQTNPDYDRLPIWLELSWPAPVSIDRVRVSESWQSSAAAYCIETWQDERWYPRATVTDRRGGGTIEHGIAPCRTRKVRFVVTALQGNPPSTLYAVNEIAVSGEADRLVRPAEPGWQAHFIWTDTQGDADIDRYFAATFDIDDAAVVERATLQAAADDGFSAFINGRLVGRGGIDTAILDATDCIRSGRNVIAIAGFESGGDEGVIAELVLQYQGGRTRTIATDATWRGSLTRPDDWPDVDPSIGNWRAVKDQGVPPNSDLHPSVGYTFVAADSLFALDAWTLSRDEVAPGESATLSITMHAIDDVDVDYTFVAELGEAALEMQSDYTIARYAIAPRTPTSQWRAGEQHTLEIDVYIPESAPHGQWPIRLAAVTPTRRAAVRGDETTEPALMIKRFDDWHLREPIIPDVRLQQVEDRVQLLVDGEVVPPLIWGSPSYRTFEANGTYATFDYPIWRIWMRNDDFYAVPDDQWDSYMDELLAGWDQRIMNVLRCDPNPYIIVGLSFRPRYEWTQRHPDEATVLADGSRMRHSFASPLWMEHSKRAIRRVVDHIMQSPYRGHVIGFNFGVGGGPETYYWGNAVNNWNTPRDEIIIGDYNPHYIAHLRQWLRDRYDNDVSALRAAWHDPTIIFDTAEPDINVLRRDDWFAFRDPIKSRMAYDYWEHHADVMADAIIELGKTFDEASGNRYIKGFWGLYSAGDNIADVGSKPGKAHHVALAQLQRVLESPHIDFIAGIQSYINLGWNVPPSVTNLAESVTAHGKLWVNEFDTRPFYATLDVDHHTWSEEETIAVLKRNIAASVVNNWTIWFQGFPEGTDGRRSVPWFGHSSLTPTMRRFRAIYDQMAAHPSPSDAQVAVFMNNADVYALDLIRIHDVLVNAQVNTWHFEMPKVAAAMDLYHLPDVLLPRMDQYKLYVFLNAYNISAEQRQRIKQLARREGKTVLWLYLPGYVDMDRGLNVEGVEDLTGFKVACEADALMPTLTLTDRDHPLTRALPADYALSPRRYRWTTLERDYQIGPVASIVDEQATVLGRYQHNGAAALAVKQVGEGQAVFVALPFIDAPLLREVCRYAGVHLFTEQPAFVDASRHWLSVQTDQRAFDGPIALPRPVAVYDMFERQIVSDTTTSTLDVTLAPNTIKLYFLGSPQEVADVASAPASHAQELD